MSSCTVVKAAASVVPSSRSLSFQSVPLIDEALLAHLMPSEQVVGQGRFGSCAEMVSRVCFRFALNECLKVCLQAVKAEAAALN